LIVQVRVWADGISGAYYRDKNATTWTHVPLLRKRLRFLTFKDDRYLWAGTEDGLFLIDTDNGMVVKQTVRLSSKDIPIPDSPLFSVCHVSQTGITWFVVGPFNLFRHDARKQLLYQLPDDFLLKRLKFVVQLSELYEYEPDWLLITQGGPPYLMNIYTQEPKPFGFRPSYNQAGWEDGVTCYYEEKNGLLWMGTASGLFLFDKNRQRFLPLEKWMEDEPLLHKAIIRHLAQLFI
jgi:hypothetical protein